MLLTKTAYAHHCGVSRQTVYGWVAKGEVVMSGNKIDVEATKQMQHGNEHSERKYYLVLSASQVIKWIHTNQDKFLAAQSQEEAKQLQEAATQLISYDIEYLCDEDGEEVVRLHHEPGDCEHYFHGFHQLGNAIAFIQDFILADCLRMKLRGKGDHIDPERDRWSVKGLKALCTPTETDEARLKRFHEHMGEDES
ncbi:hypothetical protein QU819_14965 [Enterobacter roggenkampii]|uniref:hypothetical protein n=1 Tax=Enterobacter roggenkampii TaxID=1812935 RepID=UPI00222F4CD9|nr:hypothetical protein [Enterobacter roggenkampii]MDM9076666.1 hypothetical protein [Enterobacter roggenkampii]